MLAAYYGHPELVRLLIQHGADPNRLNDRGQSPLAGAVFKKEDAVIDVSRILSKKGCATKTSLTERFLGIAGGWCGPGIWLAISCSVHSHVQARRPMGSQV